ncbi:MAG TPA: hypothetical protein VK085_13375, partial [Pseudogracilibacillus sp.]|nr:hypothetical protein [Pseudogracilibacillus sp.]
MTVLFGNQKKWTKKGLGWCFAAVAVLFTIYLDVYLNETITPLAVIIQLIGVSISVYQGIHNLNKPQKAYVKADDNCLSIYRSPWTPRETINCDEINGYYTVSTLLVLQLKNGREAQFDLELFSESDVTGIKRLIESK